MWPQFSRECRREVDSVLRSGRLTAYKANGKRLEPDEGSQAYALEREIEKKFKVKHAIVTNSGTAAIHAGLEAIGVRDGEVLCSPFTFSATAAAICHAGGRPVFVDIDPHTFTVTAETLKPFLTRRTKAIVAVDLFGYLPDYRPILDFEVPLFEDACQAVGASRDGHYSGTQGTAASYSYNGGKNCPAGEGGTLTTNSDKIAERARLHVNHGENFGGDVGFNYRMTEMTACVARHGLKELEERNQRRRELVMELSRCMMNDGTGLAQDASGDPATFDESHVYYVVPWVLSGIDRTRVIARCARRGLKVQESYTTPLHHLKAFRKYATRELPVVDELHSKTLCLLTNLTPDKPLSEARRTARIIRESLE